MTSWYRNAFSLPCPFWGETPFTGRCPNYQWSNSEEYGWINPLRRIAQPQQNKTMFIRYMYDCSFYTFLWYNAPSWWRDQMETLSTLLAICPGNSPATGEFPAQRPVTRSFDVFFDLHLNKRLSKQSWGWWLEMLSRPLWRHYNVPIATRLFHSLHTQS